MSNAPDDLISFIPRLRRHARLLCGSKEIGDEYVRLCLELLVEEPERFDPADPVRSVYRALHTAWTVVGGGLDHPSPLGTVDFEARVDQGVTMLPPMERRVLLLAVVENLSNEAIADILGLDLDEVAAHLAKAHRDLDAATSVRTLVIEDEPLIALEIATIVRDMGHEVVATTTRQQEAVELARSHEPGLVLADIRLADDESGIVAVRDMLESLHVPVVFVTGYPERLLTGERREPAFVVPKPFEPEALKATIAHALSLYSSPGRGEEHRERLLEQLHRVTGRDIADRSQ